MSDSLIKVGPLKIGLDGVLTWVPGVGDVYGLGASAFLLHNATQARASNETIVKMMLLLGTDALIGGIPVVGDLFDMVFRAHARSARLLLDHIEEVQAAAALPPPVAAAPPPRSEPRPDLAKTPSRAPAPPPSPEAPTFTEDDEWEQARRVEQLRAEVRERGGGIIRPRP